MESNKVGMQEALAVLKQHKINTDLFCVQQLNDDVPWTHEWHKKISGSYFVLISWMGVGLCCGFLKAASVFMQEQKIRHFFNIVDPGEDIMEYGITDVEKQLISKYFMFGGMQNYKGLCSWMMKNFANCSLKAEPPLPLPWHGIYHPGGQGPFFSLADYKKSFWQKGRPTVGFIFSREEWLWHDLEYHDAVIKTLERRGCNVVAVFSSTKYDEKNGSVALSDSIAKFFFESGKPAIDVLINTFHFSLLVRGYAKLGQLVSLGVPILQTYNIHRGYADWQKSISGLSFMEVASAAAMPEFDGIIHSVLTSTYEERGNGIHYRAPVKERIDMLARKAYKWAMLRYKQNSDKRVAIVFHNYPANNSSIGTAMALDSIESIRRMLVLMKQQGYTLDHVPEDGRSFIEEITVHATNDRNFMAESLWQEADGKLSENSYYDFFAGLPESVQSRMLKDWGSAPGTVFRYNDELIIPGVLNGNVFITVQADRGFGDAPEKIYHSPDFPPTHHYLGYYHWLREVWQADVIIHVGTHGNLEWLPGKGTAMSGGCYPDISIGDTPNIYPYWITCVGEGIQAKRRSAACLISYLSAPMSTAGMYGELADLEHCLEEYCHFKTDVSVQARLSSLQEMIRVKASECNLDDEVIEAEAEDFDAYVNALHVYLSDIKNMQISTGLHILGNPPENEELLEYILALTKYDNGKIPSLLKTLALMHGYEYYVLIEESGKMLPDRSMSYGMLLDVIREQCSEAVKYLQKYGFKTSCVEKVFDIQWTNKLEGELRKRFLKSMYYICEIIVPNLQQIVQESENILKALDGCYIEPCPAGTPTSGGADLLPTGKNFYSVDPRTLPTKAAWKIGKQMADDVIRRYIREEGHYPESVGIILWATNNLRSHGQCVAEFLYLMGLKPVWQEGSHRVVGVEVISLEELKRPRIDVTGRISGLFRDSMPTSVTSLDEAVDIVAGLEESVDVNFIRKHVLEDAAALEKEGIDPEVARKQAAFRIFGDAPGAYGAGIDTVLEAKNWDTVDDLAEVYTRWGGYAYGRNENGIYLPERFKTRLSKIDITIFNMDNRESSLLSGDDYNSYRGGMVAAVRSYKGSMPKNYISDSSDPEKIQLRSLKEELIRWFRGEAINPKYIEGMKKHGYKGAGDLAKYVAVSYQWDATSETMEDWMYEKYAEKYALDKEMQKWMCEVNPWALKRISEILLEAEQRGLWQAKTEIKQVLQELLLKIEGELEEQSDH